MAAFIDKLFIKSQADAIRTLWEDTSSRSLIQQEIGKKLLDHDKIIGELPLTQVMFIVSLSPFADSEKECNEIAEMVYWGIHRKDIVPMITEHNGKELAYRCLISLGFFKEYLTKRWERFGAPSPSYYRQVGIKSFKEIGRDDIGNHFGKWEGFMSEFFV